MNIVIRAGCWKMLESTAGERKGLALQFFTLKDSLAFARWDRVDHDKAKLGRSLARYCHASLRAWLRT